MTSAAFTEEQLVDWFFRLGPLHGALLDRALGPAERIRRGGLVLSIGPGLVAATAEGITAAPHLFPDAPMAGPDLRSAQRTAEGWRLLRDRLQAMASLASDGHLAAQTRLTGLTLPFLRKALAQVHPAGLAAADIPRRNMALVPAFLMVHAYYKALAKARARTRARTAPAAAAAPGSASPRQRRYAAEKRAEARATLERVFTAILRARRAAAAAQPLRDGETPAHY